MMQDGVKEISAAVEKAMESVKYIKGSQVRRGKFLEKRNILRLEARCSHLLEFDLSCA